MTRFDALERELTVWFDETAMPRRPDYTTEIIQATAALPQRRWMTIERWFPMNVVEFRRRTFPPFPWRTAAVLVALIVLLLAGLVYVGSQPRLPPPFGLAGNGLVAYAKDGDILTVDPTTGVRNWITAGDDVDALPRWSPDGTRLAFLRGPSTADRNEIAGTPRRVVIVDRERNVLAEGVPLGGVDPDAFAWSPDGRYIAVGGMGLYVVDTADGGVRSLDVAYTGLDFYWRPGHPTEILFRGETAEGSGLVLVDVDRPGSARLVAADADHYLRPNGWTPDGRRIVFTRVDQGVDGSAPAETRILDVTTHAVVDIEAGYADISNDGKRIVAIDPDGRPCIASIDGGPCVAIADSAHAYDGTFAGGTFWAPDDGSIVATISADVPPPSRRLLLLDPEGRGTGAPAPWMADGAESWQRVAP
jgi:dipeptidyl aminopeptidase/acylaminoacyl peptidase